MRASYTDISLQGQSARDAVDVLTVRISNKENKIVTMDTESLFGSC